MGKASYWKLQGAAETPHARMHARMHARTHAHPHSLTHTHTHTHAIPHVLTLTHADLDFKPPGELTAPSPT